MSNTNDDKKYFSLSMSKARYQQVAQIIEQALDGAPNKVEPTLTKIRDLFKFDPNKNSYHQEYGNTQVQRRKQLQQEKGISSYELFNKKYIKSKSKKKTDITCEQVEQGIA